MLNSVQSMMKPLSREMNKNSARTPLAMDKETSHWGCLVIPSLLPGLMVKALLCLEHIETKSNPGSIVGRRKTDKELCSAKDLPPAPAPRVGRP